MAKKGGRKTNQMAGKRNEKEEGGKKKIKNPLDRNQ